MFDDCHALQTANISAAVMASVERMRITYKVCHRVKTTFISISSMERLERSSHRGRFIYLGQNFSSEMVVIIQYIEF